MQNIPWTETRILDIDRKHIWHPYSAFNSSDPLYPVKSATGVEIELFDGRRLIDGMASWWSVIHGYNHPRLNQAAKNQIDQFSHVMFGGLTHEPAARLTEQLIQISPTSLNKVFFSDSGSVSVEVAMKMAIQFQLARGMKNKNRFLSFRGAYHGDTFKAMSVCDPINGMHAHFSACLDQQFFCDAPACGFGQEWQEQYIENLQLVLSENSQHIAAIILEPIVQGAGGMRFYSPQFLKRTYELAQMHDVLFIADEIATGFGRSGKLFACEHAEISPDIMCLGKTLTGGYLSFAATLCTDDIASTICASEPGVLMHGPTYMGNPLACAIASESISLLIESDWTSNIQNIEKLLLQGLMPATELNSVHEVRVLGGIGVIEMKSPVSLKEVQPMFVEKGIWLRPFGKLIYTMPPYIISSQQLTLLCEKIVECVQQI